MRWCKQEAGLVILKKMRERSSLRVDNEERFVAVYDLSTSAIFSHLEWPLTKISRTGLYSMLTIAFLVHLPLIAQGGYIGLSSDRICFRFITDSINPETGAAPVVISAAEYFITRDKVRHVITCSAFKCIIPLHLDVSRLCTSSVSPST